MENSTKPNHLLETTQKRIKLKPPQNEKTFWSTPLSNGSGRGNRLVFPSFWNQRWPIRSEGRVLRLALRFGVLFFYKSLDLKARENLSYFLGLPKVTVESPGTPRPLRPQFFSDQSKSFSDPKEGPDAFPQFLLPPCFCLKSLSVADLGYECLGAGRGFLRLPRGAQRPSADLSPRKILVHRSALFWTLIFPPKKTEPKSFCFF